MMGLSDAQVAADYGSGRLRWRFLWAAAKVVGALPFAIVGMVIHVVPYTAVKMASRVPNNNGIRATVKLLGCFFMFTAVYAALGVVAGVSLGALVGLLVAAGGPACGYLAVRLMERLRRIETARQGYRSGRDGGPMLESVLARRSAVVDAASAVMAVGGPTPPGP